MVHVVTNDGVDFELDSEISSKFKIICDITDGSIPLPNVNSAVFKKILRFARDGVIACPDPWLLKDDDYKNLYDIAWAADFLWYPECMDYVCELIAKSLQGKTREEIDRILI